MFDIYCFIVSTISKMPYLKYHIWGKLLFINEMEQSTSLFSPEKSNFVVSSQCLLYGKEIKRGEKRQTSNVMQRGSQR